MEAQRPDFKAILRILLHHRVDFIVIGGVAAVLQGAPVTTFDLDVVHSRAEPNLDRLEEALARLDAHYRDLQDHRLVRQRANLALAGHHLLLTRAGPLDLIGAVVTGQSFNELLPHTKEVDLGEGMVVRILDLRTLIEIKEKLGRDRDRAVLPVLRRTLEEQSDD
jgi:predicted nucleotidyltransferase